MIPVRKERRTWFYLFFPMVGVVLLAIVAFALVSVFALRRTAYRQTEENLRQFSYSITHFLDEYPVFADKGELQRFSENFGAEPDFRITIISPDGTVLADSNVKPEALENHGERPEVRAALLGQEAATIRYSTTLGKRLVYFAKPYRGYVIRLAVTVEYVDMGSRDILFVILFAAILLVTLALAISTIASSRIIKPLNRLEAAAAEYAQGRLEVPFDTKLYPREFSELARAFSSMATALREKMCALDGQNRETNAILTGMNEALVVLDQRHLVVRINPSAELLFAFDAEDARGVPLIQLVRNTDIVDFALNRGKYETERVVELRTGEREGNRWLLVRTGTIADGGGTLLVFHDITRLKRLERIRKDFVANVSHELKTPVTSIQGFIETLKDGALEDPAAARRFLDIMDQQSSRLSAIIDDLLSISRLEQEGNGAITRETTDVNALFADVLSLCADSARKKGAELTVRCPEGLSGTLNPGLMEQALVNLVQNAVKYSPEGSRVEIRADLENEEPDSTRMIVFTVSDNGPGIPERYLERIFERFYRIDKGRSRDLGGTGLGLSIVRHIALAHGGTASVKSEEGRGSTFTIRIPSEV